MKRNKKNEIKAIEAEIEPRFNPMNQAECSWCGHWFSNISKRCPKCKHYNIGSSHEFKMFTVVTNKPENTRK